jgi:hypothetical protein
MQEGRKNPATRPVAGSFGKGEKESTRIGLVW